MKAATFSSYFCLWFSLSSFKNVATAGPLQNIVRPFIGRKRDSNQGEQDKMLKRFFRAMLSSPHHIFPLSHSLASWRVKMMTDVASSNFQRNGWNFFSCQAKFGAKTFFPNMIRNIRNFYLDDELSHQWIYWASFFYLVVERTMKDFSIRCKHVEFLLCRLCQYTMQGSNNTRKHGLCG